MTRRLLVFAPAGIVLIVGLLSYGALRRAVNTRDWVIHTRDILDASSTLLTALLDAETGQRGYLLTQDSAFLGPYRTAGARADSMMVRLRMLTVDNPNQQVRLDTLATQVHRRLALVDSSIAEANAGRRDLATAVVATGPGRPIMTDVRRLIGGLEAEEERLLEMREADEASAMRLTSALLLVGTVLAAILALLVNRGFDRALSDRRQALSDSESANARLQEQAIELEAQAEAAQSMALEAEEASDHAREALYAAEESEHRAERLQTATEAFGGALSLDEVANLIVDQAMTALNADSGLLAGMDRATDVLRFIAVHGIPSATVGGTISVAANRPLCAAVRTARPILLDTAEAVRKEFPNSVSGYVSDDVQSIAAFPMEYNGRVLGALLVRFSRPRTLTALDVSLMIALCRIAAESFERARLFDAEREARTAAEAANRAKAAFLASMSHELRTPLQAALGFAQLVRSGVYGPVNDQQAEVLGRIERSQTHLARLIDDILDFARLEAGRVRVKMESVAIADVFGDFVPLVEPQAVAKNIELSVVSPASSMCVAADRHRLQQILVNLVGNAIKFTDANGSIRVAAVSNDGHASIQIADTGPGIPADRLDAIFEPFVQLDDALTRTQSGTGLGLAISRDLARAMGGDLTAASELGTGSTFSVTLPLAN